MKKPETVQEFIDDPIFNKELKAIIDKQVDLFNKRPDPKPGYRYKKTPLERMINAGNMHPDFFLKHMNAVVNKQSDLNSEFRSVVLDIVKMAYYKTIIHYRNEPIPTQQSSI